MIIIMRDTKMSLQQKLGDSQLALANERERTEKLIQLVKGLEHEVRCNYRLGFLCNCQLARVSKVLKEIKDEQ